MNNCIGRYVHISMHIMHRWEPRFGDLIEDDGGTIVGGVYFRIMDSLRNQVRINFFKNNIMQWSKRVGSEKARDILI